MFMMLGCLAFCASIVAGLSEREHRRFVSQPENAPVEIVSFMDAESAAIIPAVYRTGTITGVAERRR
jgi:hypothetical protein